MNNFLNNLEEFGFAKLEGVFSDRDKELLKSGSEQLLREEKISYKNLPSTSINDDVEMYFNKKNISTFFNTINRHFIGNNEQLDSLFSKLFSDTKIKKILELIFGKNYKLHTCLLRKADENSSYMGLHTDNNYAFTMSILCNDLDSNDPTTVFLPGSHKFNYSFKNKIERLNPKYFSFLTKPSVGRFGDINCFFNKTVHGIKKCSTNKKKSNTIWLLGFHRDADPVAGTIMLPEYTNYNKRFADVMSPDALKMFEFDPNSRKRENEMESNRVIDQINKKNHNSFNLMVIYYFFKMIEIIIKSIRKIFTLTNTYKTQ